MQHLIPKHQLGNIILPHKVVTYDRNDARSYWGSLNNNIQSGVRNERGRGHRVRHGDFYYNSKSGKRTGSAPQGLKQVSPEFDAIGLGRAIVTSLGKGIVEGTVNLRHVPERELYSPDKLASDRQAVIDFFKSPEYSHRFTEAIKTPGSKLNIYDKFDVQKAATNNVTNARVVKVPDELLKRDGAIATSGVDGIINIPKVSPISNNTIIHELSHQSALNGSTLPKSVSDWNASLMPTPRDIPEYYSSTLKHAADLKYLSRPDELRAKAINTMLWANKNGVTPSDIPKLLPSKLPMDTDQLYSMFDDNSIINYLNKFLMFTGAAGMANKKASPK